MLKNALLHEDTIDLLNYMADRICLTEADSVCDETANKFEDMVIQVKKEIQEYRERTDLENTIDYQIDQAKLYRESMRDSI